MGSTLAALPLKQTGCKNIKRSLGQSVQWSDPPPHLESEFQSELVALRCGGQPVSSSHPLLGAERWRTDGEKLHDLRRTGWMYLLVRSGRRSERGLDFPLLPSLSPPVPSNRSKPRTSDRCPAVVLWQPKNGERREQEVAWTDLKASDVGGEKDLCWEVSSLEIRPSTEAARENRLGLKSVLSEEHECSYHLTNRSLLTSRHTNCVSGCLKLLEFFTSISLSPPHPSLTQSDVM